MESSKIVRATIEGKESQIVSDTAVVAGLNNSLCSGCKRVQKISVTGHASRVISCDPGPPAQRFRS